MEVYKLLVTAAQRLSAEETARRWSALSSPRNALYNPPPPPPAPNTTYATLQPEGEKMKSLAQVAEQLLNEQATMLQYPVSALPRGQPAQATISPSVPSASTALPVASISTPDPQPPTHAPAPVPAIRRDLTWAQTPSHDANGFPLQPVASTYPLRPDRAPGINFDGKRTRYHPEVLAWLRTTDKVAADAKEEADEGMLFPEDLLERAPPPPEDPGLFALCALCSVQDRRRLAYWVLWNVDRKEDTLDRLNAEINKRSRDVCLAEFWGLPDVLVNLAMAGERAQQRKELEAREATCTDGVPPTWWKGTPRTRAGEKRKAGALQGEPQKKRRRPAKLTMKKGARKGRSTRKPEQEEQEEEQQEEEQQQQEEQEEQEQDIDVETESAVLMPPPPPPAPGRVVLRLPVHSSAPRPAPTAAPAAVLAATPAAVPVPAAEKPKPTPAAKPKPSPKKPKTTKSQAPKPTEAPKRQSKRIQAANDVKPEAARFASENTLFTSKSSTLVNSMPPDLKRVVEGVKTPEPEKLEAIEEQGEEEVVAPEPEPETKTKNARKPKGKKTAKGKGKAKAPPVDTDATEDEPDLPQLPRGLEKAETVKSWTDEVAASEAGAVEEAQVEEEINVVEEVPVPDTTARAGSRAARARRPTQKAREAAAKASQSKAKSSRPKTKTASAGVEV
ncbi:hypothetical protein GLOTRDRAFT_92414 [Gloeophyllum trabeum ATCC 11539]|uniref:Uncharacterized protein n=1 Tax=Gloeophyllum trabeum (strain ATCC 11539 / FP-39264 / Madison 617) TaxID=670483 RepID=S7QD90_GLOTA|nr:uncharacterized protein GLOTRDRAFT_92414 [Gloeophyllum trabeum ATCC 11539]EPQ57358.1 hypothetical protein GLOTRDRAFT_92414 [Gloeophyllum trabeum ATCC 11539]